MSEDDQRGAAGAEKLATLPGVRVAAVSDPQRDRAEALAASCGATVVGGVEAVVDAGVDCLYVCVPPSEHGAPEVCAVEADVPVFVEKPLAADLSTAEEIGERLTGAGLLAVAGYQWRYLDTLETARRLLADAPARLVLGAWLDKAPRTPWWADQRRSGGQMVEQATHLLDVARVLVGEVLTVRGDGAHDPAGPGDILHAATSTARFDSGAVGSFSTTCLLPGGYRMAVELFAAGLAVQLTESDLTLLDGDGRRTVTPQVDPVLEADRQFVAAVRGAAADLRTPYQEALRTHRLAWAVEQATRSGATVDLVERCPDPRGRRARPRGRAGVGQHAVVGDLRRHRGGPAARRRPPPPVRLGP
jgi:myo-inositol 2-dehydrogenase/D-chiro-inositol 1-dehydrogenase